MHSFLRTKNVKGRTIIIGLKSDNSSREMLLRVLTSYVTRGDNVLDPNTFHIHEDLCKSKQVDFQIKVCVGNSYVSELAHQFRVNIATVLAIGCSSSCFTKELPPTCSLMVIDNGGKILVQKQGTSQRGSMCGRFQSSLLYQSKDANFDQLGTINMLQKSSTMSEAASSSMQQSDKRASPNVKRSVMLEANISCRKFTSQEISSATNSFDPCMIIAEGENSSVYKGELGNGQAATIKILKKKLRSPDDFFQEVDLLSGMKHENIVQIIGYCYTEDINAIVYNLLKDSLNRKMRDLRWNERLGVAIGVAKALEFLHHSCDPPVIHRDVKSSNILLSDTFRPQLSDFGAAMVHRASEDHKAFLCHWNFWIFGS